MLHWITFSMSMYHLQQTPFHHAITHTTSSTPISLIHTTTAPPHSNFGWQFPICRVSIHITSHIPSSTQRHQTWFCLCFSTIRLSFILILKTFLPRTGFWDRPYLGRSQRLSLCTSSPCLLFGGSESVCAGGRSPSLRSNSAPLLATIGTFLFLALTSFFM